MKKYLKIFICLTASLAPLAGNAWAGTFSENLALTSNYVFRGITQSAKRPALQGGLDYDFENGLSTGTWISTVQYGDGTPIESEIYGEYQFPLGALNATVGVRSYLYPSSGIGGPYNQIEFEAGLRHEFKMFEWSAKANFGPGSAAVDATENDAEYNQEYWITTGVSAQILDWLSASTNIGYQGYIGVKELGAGSASNNYNYLEYDVGLTAKWKKLALDMRVENTDRHISGVRYFATGPFFVATVTFTN